MEKPLYEGKAKKVYQAEDPRYYRIEYKDDATAQDGLKKGSISGKGIINNKMSNMIFQVLEQHGIKTHFVKEISDRETLVKKVEIIPLEVIIRNLAAGSFSKRYGVEEGRALSASTLEFCLKDDALHDPLLNDSHIIALGILNQENLRRVSELAFDVNRVLTDYFAGAKLKLVDFKLEFGRSKEPGGQTGEILLADEISPDTCRLWDMDTGEKLDKDRFRRDLGGVEEAYEEVFRRISSLGETT